MRKYFLSIIVSLFFLLSTSLAWAVPFSPPKGPLFMKGDILQQLSPDASILSPQGVEEINWGLFRVSGIWEGDGTGQDFGRLAGNQIFNESSDNGQILGIFGNIEYHAATAEDELLGEGGELHFYYNDSSMDFQEFTGLDPADRVDDGNDFTYPGFTDGELLAKFELIPGAITSNYSGATTLGTKMPSAEISGEGQFLTYGNVMTDGDGNPLGSWGPLLGTQFFNTALGDNTADAYIKSSYYNTQGDYWGDPENNIFGSRADDPMRLYAVPEPTTLLLLGTGLLGLAIFGRKKLFKVKKSEPLNS